MGNRNNKPTRNLALGFIVLFVFANIGVALSIDHGNILGYIVTGLLIYLAVRCGIQLIKSVFYHDNEQKRTTRRAQKAH